MSPTLLVRAQGLGPKYFEQGRTERNHMETETEPALAEEAYKGISL